MNSQAAPRERRKRPDKMFQKAIQPMSVPCFDEMTNGDGAPRALVQPRRQMARESPPGLLDSRREQAEMLFRRIGITFAVYGDKEAAERLIPFDIIPRLLGHDEWLRLEAGLIQRVKALNMFLTDIYGAQEIVRAGIVPEDLVFRNPCYRPEMQGHRAPHDIWTHIAGIDIVRVDDHDFYVLEDNCRTPSGVSYMLENREMMMRLAPGPVRGPSVMPVENYPDALLASLRSVAPPDRPSEPNIVILTPGQFNSAYYEHSFLADKLGVELVEGGDLTVKDDVVYMRTTEGPKRVDVIYRRVDDDFIDPLVFRPDSVLGAAGPDGRLSRRQCHARQRRRRGRGRRQGDLHLHAGDHPVLSRRGAEAEERRHLALPRARRAEIRARSPVRTGGQGGQRLRRLRHAGRPARQQGADRGVPPEAARPRPTNFIAQPTLSLSTCPTSFPGGVAPRHVDLRPFVLSGADGVRVVPGGLTRVALKEGSLVVNSSQGGGTKDTWVLGNRRRRRRDRRTAGRSGNAFFPHSALKVVPCSPAPPTISTGSRAIWSAPIFSPA